MMLWNFKFNVLKFACRTMKSRIESLNDHNTLFCLNGVFCFILNFQQKAFTHRKGLRILK